MLLLLETYAHLLPSPADFVWPKADSVEPTAEALAKAGLFINYIHLTILTFLNKFAPEVVLISKNPRRGRD